MVSLVSLLFGCGGHSNFQVGGLYSVEYGDGTYRVAKVLAVEKAGVHVRLYKNEWKERPQNVDPSVLSLGSVNDGDGFGMGHLPLTAKGFAAWKPALLSKEAVSKDELEGYEMWKEGGGGFWQ